MLLIVGTYVGKLQIDDACSAPLSDDRTIPLSSAKTSRPGGQSVPHTMPMSFDTVNRLLLAQSHSLAQALFYARPPQPRLHEQTLMSISEIRYL
ncbi:hypothetical protein OX90_08720 [Pseudomonas coronafaciens pv. porri]|uniref:Uncharacterized protein n=1 Tax=Pseudomonas coronafaciens pv. porri TaxID=83964 RepID=A0ABR5JQY8_9PSED|nr:hypothetical protein OA77_06015 [Pseudomonas coronafaciens]KOP54962.1 hypothetical protein OX88_15500 [Pseudomonas coronafaciens pv. porri]KOP59937.1 hypothetical protein OX90_08720 [Pseudomonas coronafaciens pv. porri]